MGRIIGSDNHSEAEARRRNNKPTGASSGSGSGQRRSSPRPMQVAPPPSYGPAPSMGSGSNWYRKQMEALNKQYRSELHQDRLGVIARLGKMRSDKSRFLNQNEYDRNVVKDDTLLNKDRARDESQDIMSQVRSALASRGTALSGLRQGAETRGVEALTERLGDLDLNQQRQLDSLRRTLADYLADFGFERDQLRDRKRFITKQLKKDR